jgi:hypothetical protein
MFKHPAILLAYFKYAILPALIACIPMFFFLRDARFSETWLLYLGDALFLVSMIIVMVILNKKTEENAATGSLLIVGHAITIFSIVIVAIVGFILLLVFVPDLFSSDAGRTLKQTPANMIHGNTNGLAFIVFMNALFGTGSAGSFVSIMMSYTMKKEQRGDRAEI